MRLVVVLVLISMASCSTARVRNIHTPTRREINRAMKYSTSEYHNNLNPIISITSNK